MTVSDEALLARARDAATRTRKLGTVRSDVQRTEIGAAALTPDGSVYTGALIETRDRHQTIHAERLAVAKAISDGASGVSRLAMYANYGPARLCGSCRQFVHEFATDTDVPIVTEGVEGEVERHSLSELYPTPWPAGERGEAER